MNISEFRSKIKEVLDEVDAGKVMYIERGKCTYEIRKSGEYVHAEPRYVHKNGKDVHKEGEDIQIKCTDSQETEDKKTRLSEAIDKLAVKGMYVVHGCGCEKGETYLCKKHQRL